MNDTEKKNYTLTLLENDAEATDSLLTAYLLEAKEAILNRLYPYGRPESADVPTRYEITQCKLAARYFLRRGAEGEISHNENGINRTYDSVDDMDILGEVTPYAGI